MIPSRLGSAAVFAVTVVVAAGLFAIVLHTLQSDTDVPDRRAIGLALTQALAMVLALRLPWAGWLSATAALISASVWVDAELWVDPMINSYLVVLGVIALRVEPRAALMYWAATFVSSAALAAALRPANWFSGLVEAAVVTGLVLVSGSALRSLAAARRSMRDQQQAIERHRERVAVFQERTRIARELHDVVAHHMSVIAIQAEAAQYRDAEQLPQTLTDIRDSATTALGEMRRILGVLRSGDSGVLPQPTLYDLGRLTDSVRATGIRVDLALRGEPSDVPTAVGLSAYRIVQEALSNAAQHAPGAAVQVRVVIADKEIRIDVDNACNPVANEPGSGLGLAGMRERVMVLGGSFRSGRTADNRFAIAATLPIREAP